MTITQLLLNNPNNRPALRNTGNYTIRRVEGIVIHWTANIDKGADAVANRNYFNTTDRRASAHYIVDQDKIIQCIPDNEVAWHVGDKKRGNQTVNISNPNFKLIGIEMCVNKDSNWTSTYNRTIWLVKKLMTKYELSVDNIYRHYDITGKECPLMFLPDKVNGEKFHWNWLIFLNSLTAKEPEVQYIEKIVYKDIEPNFTTADLFRMLITRLWQLQR